MNAEYARPGPSSIITGPESLSMDMTYDRLIADVGGKAAGLLWIQKHLPDIPMARMIVAPPGISEEAIIASAHAQGLRFPWIIRPSTPLDNLPGHEDEFPTEIARNDLQARIGFHEVKVPREGTDENPHTSVIIAELSESPFTGTIIQHPNRPNFFIINVNQNEHEGDVQHAIYMVDGVHVVRSEHLALRMNNRSISETVDSEIPSVVDIFRRVIAVPGLESTMRYQGEFGLDPQFLFQIRDFLPVQRADFDIEHPSDFEISDPTVPLVFGITPKEGVRITIFEYSPEDILNAKITDSLLEPPESIKRGIPTGIKVPLVVSHKIRFPREANFFTHANGIFAHDDVRAIRTAPFTIITSGAPFGWSNVADRWNSLSSGDIVRIFSDGVHVRLEKET